MFGVDAGIIFDWANPEKSRTGVYRSYIAPHPKYHRKRADIERFPKNTNIPRGGLASAKDPPEAV